MNPWPLWLLFFSLVCVVPPKTQTHKRLVMVIDCSGSMGEECWSAAMNNFRMIAQQPTDDMELVVYAFGSRWSRYPEKGYLRLPDAEAINQADAWLHSLVLGTDTFPVMPLIHAIKEPGPRTVVLVTDGHFYGVEPESKVVEAVGKEPVRCIGVGEKRREVLEKIGANGGGYWHDH